MSTAEADTARVDALMEGLDAVGWTDGSLRAALLNAIKETRGRAAGAAQRYLQANAGCTRRARAATTIAADILRDDRE